MDDLDGKVERAKKLVEETLEKYERVAVACSFGKDSVATVHIAQQVKHDIPVFTVMTQFKPKETFEYLKKMTKKMNLNLKVFMVADEIPASLQKTGIRVELLPTKEFKQAAAETRRLEGKEIYEAKPDKCCELLKVEPTRKAVKDLDAWICGLRNTEGRTRKDYKEVEKRGTLVKVNPILTFTEEEVLQYLKRHRIPLHPWYTKRLPDGRRYRSLGCEPCTKPIFDNQREREGRWQNTSKCGGECGIHTKTLK